METLPARVSPWASEGPAAQGRGVRQMPGSTLSGQRAFCRVGLIGRAKGSSAVGLPGAAPEHNVSISPITSPETCTVRVRSN